jgi:hypothetical protein
MKSIGLIVGIALALGACQGKPVGITGDDSSRPIVTAVPSQRTATLVIDTGEKMATYSGQVREAVTVLELLKQTAGENKIAYETKDYDFGTMVEAIEGKKNNADKVWIYYVNGKAGEVGAGEKQVQSGDMVEWKYIPPIY